MRLMGLLKADEHSEAGVPPRSGWKKWGKSWRR
jgi:hypothetical protein